MNRRSRITRRTGAALVALALSGSTAAASGAPGERELPATAAAVAKPLRAAPPAAWPEEVVRLLRESDAVVAPRPDVHPITATHNREAIIPPMCYTRTEGRFNPCYVCHQDARAGRENRMDDADLQLAYSFSEVGSTNHWRNLFEDRRARVAAIGDEEILAWVAEDNYSELPARLREAKFRGWIPDLENLAEGAAAFDAQGFAKDGSDWVAYNFKPFPSTFWPTNGSTDDVMIRLADVYRTDGEGKPSRDAYLANLAILEASIKELAEIDTAPIDERRLGVDLDGDGELAVARRVQARTQWVGAGADHFFQAGTYPQGTEFLHTVRYLGFTPEGTVTVSRRMKEVRYMKKWKAYPKIMLTELYAEEGYAKDAGLLPAYANLWDWGLDNGMGWSIQGFLENRNGRLRAANHEETLFCMGCHNSIGATIDKTFSFARKVDGAAGWGYVDLERIPDVPNRGETRGEFATYFERAGGGDEFRSNPEMRERWFREDGTVDHERLAKARSIHEIVAPSRERALALNKAYRVIVEDQDFVFGRDATITPPANVYDRVDPATAPTLPPSLVHSWDIRLDWGRTKEAPPLLQARQEDAAR